MAAQSTDSVACSVNNIHNDIDEEELWNRR